MEILIYLGKSALVLALFYLIYVFLLRKETFFNTNRQFLLLGIPIAATIPLVEFVKTVYIETPEPIIASNNALFYEVNSPIEISTISSSIPLIDWWQLALLVYSIGAVIMLFRFGRQLFSLFKLLKDKPFTKRGNCIHIISKEAIAPFSFFNYIVYNPDIHSQEELSMILEHEKIHALERHSVDILLVHLLLIFQWCNPFVWFYKRALVENLEFIADRKTIHLVSSARQYQLTLVRNSSPLPIPALTNNFYQSITRLSIFGKSFALFKSAGQVKKRIVMLNKSTSKQRNSWKPIAILPLLAVFLWGFNVKEVEKYQEVKTASDSGITKVFSASEGITNANNVTSSSPVTTTVSEASTKTNAVTSKTYEPEKAIVNKIATSSEEKQKITARNHKVNNNMDTQETRLIISKETTLEELKEMKAALKEKGFSFDYSNVNYNSKNQIIAISITYKDANGNTGNYSVNSDNPINTIVIQSKGNSISVRSTGSGDFSYENDQEIEVENMEERMQEREKRMAVRKEEMYEKRDEMMAKRNDKRQEMREEMEVKREEMKERQKEMRTRMEHINEDHDEEIHGEHEAHEDHPTSARTNHNIHSNRAHANLAPEYLKHISKDSSDADLDAIVNEFEAEGISFSFGGIKRNDAGEITRIKLKLDNNNGSVSRSTYDRNGNAIGPITVGSHNGTTVMKGAN